MDRYDGRCIGGPYADRDLVAENKFIQVERLVGPMDFTANKQDEAPIVTRCGTYLFKDVCGTGSNGLWLWRSDK